MLISFVKRVFAIASGFYRSRLEFNVMPFVRELKVLNRDDRVDLDLAKEVELRREVINYTLNNERAFSLPRLFL